MSPTRHDPEFEALLDYLKRHRSFDFTGYKRTTLMRRVEKRMAAVGMESFPAYLDHLEVHPGEFSELFNTILINVTAFFRDAEAWRALAEDVVPRLIARRPDDPIRVWSAGCSSGAETYTLVMVLAEALGWDRFRERVKVYATDVDEEALAQARAAHYSAKELEGVPEELRARYFEASATGLVFRQDLRRHVIFGRHDLVHDAPMSHLDLLVCRNTLMYFNAEIQARILARFHFALNPDGYLFLGKAEMMRSHAGLFSPADLKSRLFHKVPRVNNRDRLLMLGGASAAAAQSPRQALHARLCDAAIAAEPTARVVVDARGIVAMVNSPARELFGLADRDMGRPIQDLKLSYRPVELRSHIERVTADRRPVMLSRVEHFAPDGVARYFDVHVVPLADGPSLLGVSVAFLDVSRDQRLQADLESANQELETAYEELQSTNEELETTNEELQSTIEELETTNEELQSTNEELETMNEELQSTNEELETINVELRVRTDELNEVNAYMASILTSLRVAAVVLDREMSVRVWNHKAQDLWGLRADEVEAQPLLNQDIGLPVERLKAPIRACLEGSADQQEIVLDARNRRGRDFRCRVTCAPLLGPDREIRGVVLLMEEWTGGEAA